MTRRFLFLAGMFCLGSLPLSLPAQQANYTAAEKYDVPNLQKQVGQLSIVPFFFKGGDQFWFALDNGQGRDMYYIDPATKKKALLFDRKLIVARLGELRKEKIDSAVVQYNPPFSITASQQAVQLTYKGSSYLFDFYQHTLSEGRQKESAPVYPKGVFGTVSPNKQWQLYARNHNLYLAKVGDTTEQALSTDAQVYYSFSINEGDTGRTHTAPAEAVWLEDAKRFYSLRKDNRRVGTMSVVHTLFAPRPRIETYKYMLPGDKEVTQFELFAGDVETGKLVKIKTDKWKDQEITVVKTDHVLNELFFLRKKRTCDEIELCAGNMTTGDVRVIIQEVSKPYINDDLFNVSIFNSGKDIVWWSDRTGWGHYYLYNENGVLQRALTTGNWTAGKIIRIDTAHRSVYLYGYGKEPGRNPYYAHVYKTSLNNSATVLLTPEDAHHTVFLSPSCQYLIDNYSRINTPPVTILRNTKGAYIMEVLKPDVRRLYDYGWKPAEPFTVKAADGITDLYGIMWKPFDFDATKQYPIISQVYPGPQIETVWTDFTVFDKYNIAPLTQLGFIVVSMGHRGGSPLREKAYAAYQYGNLRDAPLADDKYGLQQLARRYAFIDSNRVGIFGHSGGGMMATAAICTYPDFYKVAVASSGNYDNTIYNRNFGEGYQGIQEKVDTTVPGPDKVSFRFKTDINQTLAKNLKGHLLLVTGEVDANVHPGHTYRMVDALVKAGKDFDMLVLPGQSHHYEGIYKSFFEKKLRQYFAQHLLSSKEPSH